MTHSPDHTDMSLALTVGSLFEYGEHLISILGVILGTLGSLIVIYPGLENRYITGLIRRIAPRIEPIELARDNYYKDGVITEQGQLEPVLEFARMWYMDGGTTGDRDDLLEWSDVVERIERTEEGAIGYAPMGKWNFGPTEAGAATIEADLLFSRTLQRYCRQRGMRFVAGGFIVLLIGHVVGIIGSALAV